MRGLIVRPAEDGDVVALTALYNHYVESGPVTFDLRPKSVEERREWFRQFAASGRHRLYSALEAGELVGYAGSRSFRAKQAYETSVETTIYVAAGCEGRGVGAALYTALFAGLEGEDVHRAYAGITIPNEASEALHRRFGFEPIGTFEEVGRKFGRYWSVRWWQKQL